MRLLPPALGLLCFFLHSTLISLEDYSQCSLHVIFHVYVFMLEHPRTSTSSRKSQHVVNSIYCTKWVFLTELIWFGVTLWCLCSSVSPNAEVGSSKHISSAYSSAPFTAVQHLKIHTASHIHITQTDNKKHPQQPHYLNEQHLLSISACVCVQRVHLHICMMYCSVPQLALIVTFEPPN